MATTPAEVARALRPRGRGTNGVNLITWTGIGIPDVTLDPDDDGLLVKN